MPSFRVIVTEHTRGPKTGNFVEKVGTYNPKTKERNLNVERIKYWLSVGAKASGTMHNMLISMGVIQGKKINVLPKKSPPKKEEAAAAGGAAATVMETPLAGQAARREEAPEAPVAEQAAETPSEATAAMGSTGGGESGSASA